MINILYSIIILESSIFFCMTHDYVTVIVTVIYDIILISNFMSKNKKINGKENRNKKKKIKF